MLGLVAGVFLCWAIGAVLLYLPGRDRAAPLGAALDDPLARSTTSFPPERLLEELERVDPIGVFLGPPAIVAPPDKGARDGSGRRPRVEERRPRHGDRVRPRRRGLGLGRARAGSSSRTRTSSPASEQPRVDTAGGRAFARDGRRVRRDERPRRAARARARRAARSCSRRRSGARRSRSSAIRENGPLTRTPGRLGGTRRRPQPRRVRPRAGRRGRSRRSAASSSPGAPVGPASTPQGACGRPSSRAGRGETRRLRRSRPTSCATALAQARRAPGRRDRLRALAADGSDRRRGRARRAAAGTAG